jgi:mutator protein MutT
LVFHEHRLLITRRPEGTHLAGLWEFPGGKLEANESWEAGLQREMREELAIEVEVGPMFCEVTHAYPEKTVHLRFFVCRLVSGIPQAIGCSELTWVDRDTLGAHEFPAADREILEQLNSSKLFDKISPKSL